MAITAQGSNSDRIVRGDTGKTLFDEARTAVSSSVTWNQGDLLAFDTSAHVLKVVSTTADSANFCGIADNAITSGALVGPYDGLTAVNAAQVSPGFVGPKYGVVAQLILNTSDAFNVGAKVYLCNGGTSQTVTSVDPGDGNNIGIYVGPLVSSASAGQQGPIKLGARYAMGALNI